MAQDPFLAAHAVSDLCFEVGGEFSPASVRDQMIRAYLLVDRAFRETLIGPGRDLLVVGAGPGGLTAAIRGAELGVRAVVSEKRIRHAFLLANCKSRDVEPTLYDWPADHWSRDFFGSPGAHMELWWRANRADIVALGWQLRLPKILSKYGSLIDIRYDTSPSLPIGGAHPKVNATTGMLNIDLIDGGGLTTNANYGALVGCVGFGRERTQQGSYTGFQFWETDDLQKRDCGLSVHPRILISGGGDGALQDFARVMTLRSTKAAFANVLRALAPMPWVTAGMHSDLHSAEDTAARALSWNMAHNDAPVLKRLEAAHEVVISRLQSSSAWPAVESAVKAMIPTPVPNVHLVHRNSFFSAGYALNRFLTLLILRVLNGVRIRYPETEVVNVRSGHGSPCHSASACHGLPHDVDLQTRGASWSARFEVVVLRHGIIGPRRLFSGASPSRPRQMLPFSSTSDCGVLGRTWAGRPQA